MTLAESLPIELERVIILREEYKSLEGGAGNIGAAMMTVAIDHAQKSQIEGDVIQMLVAHERLKEITG